MVTIGGRLASLPEARCLGSERLGQALVLGGDGSGQRSPNR